MAALGDKIGSSILAQAAGVPTIPWSGSGLSVNYAECNGEVPADVYAAVSILLIAGEITQTLPPAHSASHTTTCGPRY